MANHPTHKTPRLRILIAEDDEMFLSGLQEALKEQGYDLVGIAQNGKEAIELALTTHPDLILMDIKMPLLDGLQAAKAINNQRFTPIVLLTAYADPDFLRQAKEARVVGYLLKPVSITELVSAIEVAQSIGQEIYHLEGQLADLKAKLAGRKYLDRAKGFLMDAYGMKEGEAMAFIRKEARNRRIRLEEMARLICETAERLLQKASK